MLLKAWKSNKELFKTPRLVMESRVTRKVFHTIDQSLARVKSYKNGIYEGLKGSNMSTTVRFILLLTNVNSSTENHIARVVESQIVVNKASSCTFRRKF